MPTLDFLIRQTHLQLRYLTRNPHHGDKTVTEVTPPLSLLSAASAPTDPPAGTLLRIAPSPHHGRRHARTVASMIRRIAETEAAGLVLHTHHRGDVPLSDEHRTLAHSLGVPILLTAAPMAAWDQVNDTLRQQRIAAAERQCAHLDGLLRQLPTHYADPRASQRIADWLAAALQAEVLVSSAQRGIIAAAPDRAAAGVAHALITQQTGAPDEPGEHPPDKTVRSVPIVTGGADNAILTISAPHLNSPEAASLTRHAAKILGLCDQAHREHDARLEAPRSVRHATFQLLMAGETVLAQVIYTGGAKALLDTETARVYIIDTGTQNREPTLQWCEAALRDKALVCPCPGKPGHILILDPNNGNEVTTLLQEMIAAKKTLTMGQSRPHSLAEAATSYREALSAVAKAAKTPDRIGLGGTDPKFAPLLPRAAARAWANNLLAPLLDENTGRKNEREQLLKTLPVGLGFRLVEAADALQIHRNTLANRLNRAGQLLGLDLRKSVNNRILVLLALDILALPENDQEPENNIKAPTFAKLIAHHTATDALHNWAEHRLRAIRGDRRNVTETLCVWMEHNLSFSKAATALGLSGTTVHNHIKDASMELGVDFTAGEPGLLDTDVSTIADVALALHILYGRPELSQP